MFERTIMNGFSVNKTIKRNLRNPTEIEIRTQKPENTKTWRTAILSYDQNSDQNVIARRVVEQVLNERVQPIDKETTSYVQKHTFGERVDGYVDLVWSPRSNTDRSYTTRFYVTSADNPPYDAVLGRRDAERYTMLH